MPEAVKHSAHPASEKTAACAHALCLGVALAHLGIFVAMVYFHGLATLNHWRQG